MLKIKGVTILDAGLIAKVIYETRMVVHVEVVDLFFPVHIKAHGEYRVDKDKRAWLLGRLIGRKLSFWKVGSRANFEVGGDRKVLDWDLKTWSPSDFKSKKQEAIVEKALKNGDEFLKRFKVDGSISLRHTFTCEGETLSYVSVVGPRGGIRTLHNV